MKPLRLTAWPWGLGLLAYWGLACNAILGIEPATLDPEPPAGPEETVPEHVAPAPAGQCPAPGQSCAVCVEACQGGAPWSACLAEGECRSLALDYLRCIEKPVNGCQDQDHICAESTLGSGTNVAKEFQGCLAECDDRCESGFTRSRCEIFCGAAALVCEDKFEAVWTTTEDCLEDCGGDPPAFTECRSTHIDAAQKYVGEHDMHCDHAFGTGNLCATFAHKGALLNCMDDKRLDGASCDEDAMCCSGACSEHHVCGAE